MPPTDFEDFEIKHHYKMKDKNVFVNSIIVVTSLCFGLLYYLWR